jgi:murein DD-endopeptidase MepM/ murein hydrolase activator NlpD
VLTLPIPDAPIVSAFGPRVHPVFGDVRMHEGIDLGAREGTPIYGAADGVVVSAGPLGGYGNATLVDHGSALATLYAHQSVVLVRPGDPVTKGQLIGAVGCTGLCTGAHLHFEVRVTGTPVDPIGWF